MPNGRGQIQLKMALLGLSLIGTLALAAMSASGASARMPVLELKEEGVPVPVGAELRVELAVDACKYGGGPNVVFVWPAHMSVNGAKEDKITVKPAEQSCWEGDLYPDHYWGSVNEIDVRSPANATGPVKATVQASLHRRYERGRLGSFCVNDFTKLRGRFAIPGDASFEGHGRGSANKGLSEHGCSGGAGIRFIARIVGQNNKPLEAELIR
jgi:hypothetical protein